MGSVRKTVATLRSGGAHRPGPVACGEIRLRPAPGHPQARRDWRGRIGSVGIPAIRATLAFING